jgi:phenylalanyl-tRNA synthetase beta chain
VAIGNPLSAKFAVMRRTLVPGLIDAVAHNRRHGRADVRLFEIGTRFSHAAGETRGVALACTGASDDPHWSGSDRSVDFFDVKGLVEQLAEVLGAPIRFEADAVPYLVAGQTANVLLADGRTRIGELGQLVPAIADARGLPRADRVYVAEIDLDALWYAALDIRRSREKAAAAAQRPLDAFTPLPRYPSVVRDISILVDARLPAEKVRGTIAGAGGPYLREVREFDRYQGKGIPEGRVSLSLRLTFRSDERTLTDDDVQRAMTGVLAALQSAHAAVQR